MFGGIGLTACGDSNSVKVTSISVSVLSETEIDCQYDETANTFTFPMGSYLEELELNTLFQVRATLSNGKVENVRNFLVRVVDGSPEHDYILRVAYRGNKVDFYADIEDQILPTFTNITPTGIDNNFVYSGVGIQYTGQEIDVCDIITAGSGQSLKVLIEQGFAHIVSGTNVYTNANIGANSKNSFVVEAVSGFEWNFEGKRYDTLNIEWKILPQQVLIKIPTVESYSLEFKPANDGSGEKQYLNFTFQDGQEEFFDLSQNLADTVAQANVGTYIWKVYLKSQYQNNRNYIFSYAGSKVTLDSQKEMGVVYNGTPVEDTIRLDVKWEITPYILPISSLAIVNLEDNTIYSQYYTITDNMPKYRYDSNGVRPAVNYMQYQLGYLFHIDSINLDSQMGDHLLSVVVFNGVNKSNYRFADGSLLPQSSVNLQYHIDGAIYELPEEFDKDNVLLRDAEFSGSFAVEDYISSLNATEQQVGSPVPTIACFETNFPRQMRETGHSFYLANSEQTLEIGQNEIGIYYQFNELYEPILLECTMTLSAKAVLSTIEWNYFPQNYPVYDGQGKQNEAQVSVMDALSSSIDFEQSYEVYYSQTGEENSYVPIASTTQGNLQTACVNAGYYKTVLSVDCQDGYYLYTSRNANQEKNKIFVVEYLWQIAKCPIQNIQGNWTGLQSMPDEKYYMLYEKDQGIIMDPQNSIVGFEMQMGISQGLDQDSPIQAINTYMCFGEEEFPIDQPREVGTYRTEVIFNTSANYSAEPCSVEWKIISKSFDVSSIDWSVEQKSSSLARTLNVAYIGDASVLPQLDLPLGYNATYTYYSVGGGGQESLLQFAPSAIGDYVVKTQISIAEEFANNPDCTVVGESNVTDLYFSIVKRNITQDDFAWNYSGGLYASNSYGSSYQVEISSTYSAIINAVNIVVTGDTNRRDVGEYSATAVITLKNGFSELFALAEYNQGLSTYQEVSQLEITLDWSILQADNQS